MLFACDNADSLGEELYARVTSSNGVVMLLVVGEYAPSITFVNRVNGVKVVEEDWGPNWKSQPHHHTWSTPLTQFTIMVPLNLTTTIGLHAFYPLSTNIHTPPSQHKLTLLTPFTRTVPLFPLPFYTTRGIHNLHQLDM